MEREQKNKAAGRIFPLQVNFIEKVDIRKTVTAIDFLEKFVNTYLTNNV